MYKLNDKIKKEDLLKVSQGVCLKAIKVIASKGNKIAFELLENKRKELFEDLMQEVSINILLNDYKITKECFKCVNDYIYKVKKDNIILTIDNKENKDFLECQAYCEYISKYQEVKKTNNFTIEDLGLTNKQVEILKIYSNGFSMGQVAKMLGISKGTVSQTIYRLRDKLEFLKVG